jgi:hypothetical protein
MVIETAPWIHPDYRGVLTLEIANVSNTPLLLYPGRLIGQLILLQLRPRGKPRRKLAGSYLAHVYPTAPHFKDPEEDLVEIGVAPGDFKFPGEEWFKRIQGAKPEVAFAGSRSKPPRPRPRSRKNH